MSEKAIRLTVHNTVTLKALWYDEQWHRELVAEGMTDEQALREMLRVGYEEDALSLWEELLGMDSFNRAESARAFSEKLVHNPEVVTVASS